MENPLEEGRGFRKRRQGYPVCCPVCGATIRPSEIEPQVDRRTHIELNENVKKSLSNEDSYHEAEAGCSSNGDDSSGSPWATIQKILNYWNSQLKIRTRVKKTDVQPICPICNERPNEDINIHVEFCPKKSENADKVNGAGSNVEETIDNAEESFDEYDWACEKPIRTSRVQEDGYSAAGHCTPVSNWSTEEEDEDEDLDVDEEDTQTYGPTQYEKYLMVPLNSECENEENANFYLRKLVSGQDISSISAQMFASRSSSSNNHTNVEESVHDDNEICANPPISSTSDSLKGKEDDNPGQIVESLKVKIREYENQISNKIKCLICMDQFRNPAVSICCWHVHCEECWLRTLGARKLCPQCNMITSPTDLRRIYM